MIFRKGNMDLLAKWLNAISKTVPAHFSSPINLFLKTVDRKPQNVKGTSIPERIYDGSHGEYSRITHL